MKEATITPFAKPLYIMTKPVGAVCNLACDYCYYLEKSKLYEEQPRHVMSDELLEKFIKEYIQSQTMPQVLFTWHGQVRHIFFDQICQIQECRFVLCHICLC